jgi:hypothetical protein
MDLTPVEDFAMPLHDWSDDRGWDSVHLVWFRNWTPASVDNHDTATVASEIEPDQESVATFILDSQRRSPLT